jgi:hypothetical protein
MKVYRECDLILVPTKNRSPISEKIVNGNSSLIYNKEEEPTSTLTKNYHLYIVYGNQIIASTDKSITKATIPDVLVAFYCRVNGIDCVLVEMENNPTIVKRYVKDTKWAEVLYIPTGINGNTDVTFKLCSSFKTNYKNSQ